MRHCPQRLIGGWVCELSPPPSNWVDQLIYLKKPTKKRERREKYAHLTRLAFTLVIGLVGAFFFVLSLLVTREFFALPSPGSAAGPGPDSSDTFPSEFRLFFLRRLCLDVAGAVLAASVPFEMPDGVTTGEGREDVDATFEIF